MATTFGIKELVEIEVAHRHNVGKGKCEYKLYPIAAKLSDDTVLTPLDNGGEDITVGEIRKLILKQNSPSAV